MQHLQGAGEPPHGAPRPTMYAFSLPPVTMPAPASSEVLLPTQPQPAGTTAAHEEFPAAAGSGSATALDSNEDDMMIVDVVAGGVGGSGSGSSGNRWPREETLVLIRIRSEMDAAFRNATLKAPVWEELSRYGSGTRAVIFLAVSAALPAKCCY
ncbi:hypothetical protein E2562_036662 [Oryza meyeriana var. granulata]|uniref:Myb/SANT-like DNA-binding domain-containing protein n=1 Tax=Oryza meyeriana var. granulata TaxID=110450 RepID=A0A6G1FGC4_9ORYZ|nr:hypothetical protein E2562_036662 [Oryza meyeriana var. granulata]